MTINREPPSAEDKSSAISADARLEQLKLWVSKTLQRQDLAVTTASADASFRRYFRVSAAEQTWIVMDAPPEKEDVKPFIHVAQMLSGSGVNAPTVLARDLQAGYLLLSDLGDRTYLSVLQDRERADSLYADAIDALVRMQTGCAAHANELPAYDTALLLREMQLFPDWFLTRHLQLQLSVEETLQLQSVFHNLSEAALAQPRVFVHRDYHSRNLMVPQAKRHGPNPGILDFQDAVWGPITYDLVSLLRDCYIDWPPVRVNAWMQRYRDQAASANLNAAATSAEFSRWFDLMGVQRHLKAIGIFARLWHRDGKRGYLGDIPRTLNYVRSVAAQYSELSALTPLIEQKILPALSRS